VCRYIEGKTRVFHQIWGNFDIFFRAIYYICFVCRYFDKWQHWWSILCILLGLLQLNFFKMDGIDRNKTGMCFIDNTIIFKRKLSEFWANDGNSLEAAHIIAHGLLFLSWKRFLTILRINGKAQDVRSTWRWSLC